MALSLIGGYCQANQCGAQGLVKLLWLITAVQRVSDGGILRLNGNRIRINKAGSLEEANRFEKAYYGRLSEDERIETVQLLREMHSKSRGSEPGEDGKRLRRVLRVVKQA